LYSGTPFARRIASQRLDLDYVGAQIAQKLRAKWVGNEMSEFDDA
jgi:hypothetical protein